MAPSRKRGSSKASSSVAAAAAAAAARKKVWKVGDLVLAKVKGFPAWPATVSEPEKWGYSTDWKKVLVYFFGTKQIAFCNPGDVEAFTEEKKKSLLSKRHGKGADFVRAVQEIVDSYEKAKSQELDDDVNSGDDYTISNAETLADSKDKTGNGVQPQSIMTLPDSRMESLCVSTNNNESHHRVDVAEMENGYPDGMDTNSKEQVERGSSFDHLMETRLVASGSSRKRLIDAPIGSCVVQKRTVVRRSRSTVKVEPCKLRSQRLPDMPSNGIRNESAKRSKRIRKSPGNSVWYHMDSPGYSAAFASNGSTEENESEIGTANSDSVSFSGGNTFDSSCKSDHNGIECLDQGVQLSDRCHFPAETSVLKKKRKPNRKRTNQCKVALNASPNRSPALSTRVEGTVPHSPNVCEHLFDLMSKANGDEHLPLVKRARVRMGKPPLEEKHLNESYREDSITNEQLPFLPLSCGNNLHNVNSSSAPNGNKQEVNVNGSSSPNSNRQEAKEAIWNPNTYQLRASVDGEAALPPSKRLHRALKAMSANAAEEDQTFIDAHGPSKASVSCSSDYSDKSSSHTSVDNEVGSVSEVQNANSFGGDDVNANDESETPPGLISHTCEVLEKASPEPKSCDHHIEVSSSSKSDDSKVLISTFDNSVEVTHVDNSSLNIHSDVTEITIKKSPHPSPVIEQKQYLLGSELAAMDRSSPSPRTVKFEVWESNHGTFEDTQEDKLVQDGGTSQPNHHGKDSSEVDEGRGSQGIDGADLVVVNVDSGENKHSLISPSDKNVQATCEVVNDVKIKTEEKDTDVNSMKILIAAAQARRELSISKSFLDDVNDDKAVCDSVSSLSPVHKTGALDQVSPPSPTQIYLPTAGSRTHLTCNGAADFSRGKKTIRLPEMDDPTTSSSSQRQKPSGKWANVEANAVQKSFESMLGTLSRTKESIGRATRLAIDCAKHGIAAEVLEILVRNLETGTSLHKKVDLFFLVDSITQCSRGQRGDIGDIYPSLVQRMLPRLLSAAAPPGHAARENRKQCLKVLRLWLERKTLSESIIRHHMRELESAEASYTMVHCRRPLRMERALNDPIREMEGMHVDEYGSNASFQLPGLCMPPMLEEEGSDAEEKSFEAVTPEQDPEMRAEREVTPTSTFVKHCHILEDVDGELEMEDVAPSYEMVKSSANDMPAGNNIDSLHNQFEHHPLSYAPPLPEDCPPPPPPLPASPPPVVPPPAVPSQPVRCHSFTGIVDPKFHPHSMQNTSQQHMSQQLDTPITSSVRSGTEHFYAHGCGDMGKQSMGPVSFSNTSASCKTPALCPPVHMGNSVQRIDHGPVHSKSYQLQPPPPTLSNQFSYVHDDHRRLSWMEASSSSFTKRYRYGFDMHREDIYENRDRMEFTPHEIRERCRIDAPVHSVPVQSHNPEAAYARMSQYGPPEESTRMLDRGWSFPPRTLNYHNPRPFRPPEAPRFWRPR